jgi:leader peptidase (prepilin peptidase)/N-methyltransferase
MDVLAASGFAVAGAVAAVPITAIAYSAPAHGSVRLPERWWRGAPARPAVVATVSTLTGVAAGLVTSRIPPSLALPAFWLFAVLGVGLAVIDIRRRRLPHLLTGTMVATCLVCFVVAAAISGNAHPLLRAVAAGMATTAALLIIALALPGQLGLGDVALAGAVTLNLGWLGWHAAVLGVLCGLLLQGAAGLVVRVRAHSNDPIPMGPALVAGWLAGVLLPQVI